MKKILIPALLLCSATLLSAAELKSPDGDLTINVEVKDNQLLYSVSHTKGALLLDSRMGVTVDGKDLGTGVTLAKESEYTVDETYPWRGNKSVVTNQCNGKRVEASSHGRDWAIELRAYDDGIAFRYLLNLEKPTRVTGESTNWQLPNDTNAWYHTNTRNYEDKFTNHRIDQIPPTYVNRKKKTVDTVLGAPITLIYPNGMYGVLTEANVMGCKNILSMVASNFALHPRK